MHEVDEAPWACFVSKLRRDLLAFAAECPAELGQAWPAAAIEDKCQQQSWDDHWHVRSSQRREAAAAADLKRQDWAVPEEIPTTAF